MSVSDLAPRLIDVRHQGLDRVIGAWSAKGVVVDPGPEPGIERLLEGLGEPPRALLLTHIHLDHAGAAGALVRRFPRLAVYVHEIGASHLADPTRLLASAERLYGADMQRLWGEVVPVPSESLRPLTGGETVEGFRVAYTPGHASHHVSYLDEATGDAYVGDVAGVRLAPSDYVLAPTPPPDVDLEAWSRSLDELLEWRPARLRLTHFGTVAEPGQHVESLRRELGRIAEAARRDGRERFLARLEAEVEDRAGSDADRVRLAVPPEHVWLGLERYWRKRDEPPGSDSDR